MFWMLPSSRAAGPAAGELVVGPLGRRAVRAPDAAFGLPCRASSGQAGSPGHGSAGGAAAGGTGPTDPASAGSFEYVGWVAGGWPTSGRRPAQVSPGQAAEPGSVGRSGAPGSPSPVRRAERSRAPDRHGPRPAAGSLCRRGIGRAGCLPVRHRTQRPIVWAVGCWSHGIAGVPGRRFRIRTRLVRAARGHEPHGQHGQESGHGPHQFAHQRIAAAGAE